MGPFYVVPSTVVPSVKTSRKWKMLALAAFCASVAPAQILSIVSGDGQVAPQNFQLPGPLVVAAKNASGQPMPGVTVTWALTGPGAIINGSQTVTDSSGQTTNQYVGGTIFGDTAFTQSTMTASAGGSSVVMHMTTSAADLTSGSIFVQAQVISPLLGDVISGPSGSIGSTPVQVNVYGNHQAGIQQVPNVAVRLIPQGSNGSTVTCAQGTGITDVNGIANCRPVFGGAAGSGVYSVEVGGGFRTFSPFRFTVTQGSVQSGPFRISIIGGNSQSGAPGAQLPQRLTARVEDAAGNPLANVPVVWQPPSSVTLSQIVSNSDGGGIVSAIATLGSTVGQAQVVVRTTDGSVQATFNLAIGQSAPPPGGGGGGSPAVLRILSGNNQTGAPNTVLTSPLTARVEDANGNPLSNIPVVWQPSPIVSLSNFASRSDGNGIVTASVLLGPTPGAGQVQLRTVATDSTPFGASNNIVSTLFSLTVSGGGTPTPTPGQGQPATLRILSGDGQSGAPGTQLPIRLSARVEDSGGNPLANIPVIWQTAQTVSLRSASSISDSSGIVFATAVLGTTPGPTQVQLRASGSVPTPFGPATTTIQVNFNLSVGGAPVGTPNQPGAVATLLIISGNNQSGPPNTRLPAQLVAKLQDSSGNPVPNAPVVWTPSPSVTLSNMVSTSDGNGLVSAFATLGSALGQTQVLLQTGGGITTPFGQTSGPPLGTVFTMTAIQSQPASLRILSGNNQSGLANSAGQLQLTARVEDAGGNPLPNIPVVWTGQSMSVSAASSSSNASGVVSANVTYGSSAGPAQVVLHVAGTPIQALFTFSIFPPQPANLRIISGNNQSGPPGTLPTPLTARVEDSSGNPIPNVPVVWQSLTPQSVSLAGAGSASDANGLVSATAILGSVGQSQVQLKIANLPVQVTFVLQGSVTLTGISVVSGIEQVAAPGTGFAQPIVLQVSAAEGPAAGLPVQVVANGGAPVSIATGGQTYTDATGQAVIAVQAGASTGTALLTATAGNFSVSFFLTIQVAAPALVPLNFLNAASGLPGAISPTEVLSIYAQGIAPGLQGCSTANRVLGPLPLNLANIRVQFTSGGYSAFAPVFSVCNLGAGAEYVVVETPADLPPGDTTVTIQLSGAAVAQSTTPSAQASPGIFETPMSDGALRAVLQRVDGSYVSLESPAQPGQRLRAFVTGLGRPVTASGVPINTNQAGTLGDDASPPNPVALRIAGRDVAVVSAIYSTDNIGVYVVTFDLPADAPSGADAEFGISTAVGDQSLVGKLSKVPIQ